jgi:hypothetical protein
VIVPLTPIDGLVPLGSLDVGRRFRFVVPALCVDWTGRVLSHGFTAEIPARPIVFVQLDGRPVADTPWNPEVFVEDLGP